MVDSLHTALADALRKCMTEENECVVCRTSFGYHSGDCAITSALAQYEAARQEPAKRVKLPKVTRCIETWSDYRDEVIAALKAQGIEVEAIP